MRLFERVRRGTAFVASTVNRRGQTAAGPAAAQQALAGYLDDFDDDAVSLAGFQHALLGKNAKPGSASGYKFNEQERSVFSYVSWQWQLWYALYFHRPLSVLHAQAQARAAAAAMEPSDLLRGAAAAAAAALPSVAEPACYSESDEGEGDPTSHPACGKPPRAPPRGRPTAAAVPGRRRVLSDDADTAKRRKNRKKGERNGLGGMPSLQPGECPNNAQHMARANGTAPSAVCKAAKQAAVSMQATATQPSRQAGYGGGPGACAAAAPDQAGKPDQERRAAGADAKAAERERRERKRAKKLRQKQQRAAGAVSEEAATLERARKARKKQRLKLARQQKRDAAAEAGS